VERKVQKKGGMNKEKKNELEKEREETSPIYFPNRVAMGVRLGVTGER